MLKGALKDHATPLLSLNNVVKMFNGPQGAIHVFTNLSLQIASGEFVVLVGPSGCGKTTLLRMVAGLERPTSGQVLFSGQPIAGTSLMRGIVFQEPRLFPWLTVLANLELAGDKQTGLDILDRMGLLGFSRAYPHELSGGMAKRVALARAIVTNPELLLLDEPLVNLDYPNRAILLEEIRRLWARGLTCLLVTHDLEEAIMLATRVIILSARSGRICHDITLPRTLERNNQNTEFRVWKERIAQLCVGGDY